MVVEPSLIMQHALDCMVGGLVIQRHNELALAILLQRCGRIVREAEKNVGDSRLRLDLGVRGVWQPQAEALFDFKPGF